MSPEVNHGLMYVPAYLSVVMRFCDACRLPLAVPEFSAVSVLSLE